MLSNFREVEVEFFARTEGQGLMFRHVAQDEAPRPFEIPFGLEPPGIAQQVKLFWQLQGEARPREPGRPGVPGSGSGTGIVVTEAVPAQDWGKELYRAIGGELLDWQWKGPTGAREPREGIRLVLRFDCKEPRHSWLLQLPWETLIADRLGFLALHRGFSVVRRLGSLPHRAQQVTREVRILVVVADVQSLEPTGWRQELEGIYGVRDRARNLVVEVLQQDAFRKLRSALLSERFHGIHFIGHGNAPKGKAGLGTLSFEGVDRREDKVDAEEFVQTLKDQESLEWVVLNTCHGANTREFEADVATRLANAGIPAVVAMQSRIDDRAAVAFSQQFYLRLAKGDGLERALVEGRHAIHRTVRRSFEWAKPVLYLQREVDLDVREVRDLLAEARRALRKWWLRHGEISRTVWGFTLVSLLLVVFGVVGLRVLADPPAALAEDARWSLLLEVLGLEEALADDPVPNWRQVRRLALEIRSSAGGPVAGVVRLERSQVVVRRTLNPEGRVLYDEGPSSGSGPLVVGADLVGFCGLEGVEVQLAEGRVTQLDLDACCQTEPGTVSVEYRLGGRPVWPRAQRSWQSDLERQLSRDGLRVTGPEAACSRCRVTVDLEQYVSECRYQASFTIREMGCGGSPSGQCHSIWEEATGASESKPLASDLCDLAARDALTKLRPSLIRDTRRICDV